MRTLHSLFERELTLYDEKQRLCSIAEQTNRKEHSKANKCKIAPCKIVSIGNCKVPKIHLNGDRRKNIYSTRAIHQF